MMTREEAIAFYDSEQWKTMSLEDVAKLQLYEDCLCVPFGLFHEATEKLLGRSVWSHEFARPELLRAEHEGRRDKATFADSISLLGELLGRK